MDVFRKVHLDELNHFASDTSRSISSLGGGLLNISWIAKLGRVGVQLCGGLAQLCKVEIDCLTLFDEVEEIVGASEELVVPGQIRFERLLGGLLPVEGSGVSQGRRAFEGPFCRKKISVGLG